MNARRACGSRLGILLSSSDVTSALCLDGRTKLSIRGLEDRALAALECRAGKEDASVNTLVLRLIEQGRALRRAKPAVTRHDDLDALADAERIRLYGVVPSELLGGFAAGRRKSLNRAEPRRTRTLAGFATCRACPRHGANNRLLRTALHGPATKGPSDPAQWLVDRCQRPRAQRSAADPRRALRLARWPSLQAEAGGLSALMQLHAALPCRRGRGAGRRFTPRAAAGRRGPHALRDSPPAACLVLAAHLYMGPVLAFRDAGGIS